MKKLQPLISASFREADSAWFLRQHRQAPATMGEKRITRWRDAKLETFDLQASATSCLSITAPERALVTINWPGHFTVATRGLRSSGQLWERVSNLTGQRFGDVRKLVNIDGWAHALVHDGGVFRLDTLSSWTCIDQGLTRDFSIAGLAGQAIDDMVAVGGSEASRFDGRRWKALTVPKARYSAVAMSKKNELVIAGRKGAVFQKSTSGWKELPGLESDVWGLAFFKGDLYASTFSGLFKRARKGFEQVRIGGGPQPVSTLSVGSNDHVLWSLGEFDLRVFDGKRWSRIV